MRTPSAAIVRKFRWQPRAARSGFTISKTIARQVHRIVGPGIGEAGIILCDGVQATLYVSSVGVRGVWQKHHAWLVFLCPGGWGAACGNAHGDDPVCFSSEKLAIIDLYYWLVNKCKYVIRSFAGDESPKDVGFRRLILSAIDIVRSELESPPPERTPMLGRVVTNDGKQVFRLEGDPSVSFDIDSRLYLEEGTCFYGWVANDRHGTPMGPLVELDNLSYHRSLLSEDELEKHDSLVWEKWQAMLGIKEAKDE